MKPRSASLLFVCACFLAACSSTSEGTVVGKADGGGIVVFDAPLSTAFDARPDSPVSSSDGGGGGGDFIFDPCRPDPRSGYDPAGAGLDSCCTKGPAHCVPRGEMIPLLADYLAPCNGGAGACMPDPIIQAGGNYRPPSCTSSVIPGPGACLSVCIPLVAGNPLAELLAQDGCGTGEKCIPCTNPLDGSPTGACNLIETLCPASGADAGVADAGPDAAVACPHTGPAIVDPMTLPQCAPACGGSHCVPATLVPPAQQPLLASCAATGGAAGFCAPDELIRTGGNFVPPTCKSVAGAEGRCLLTCLPDIAEKAAFLPRDSCGASERCAPCFDPTSSEPTAPTGACTLACDAPKNPPLVLSCPWTGPPVIDPAVLPACAPACGGAHCVPSSLVPDDLQTLLAACPGGFCAPDPIIAAAGQTKPKACRSVANVEGRCLSTCIPQIAEQAELLPTAGCAAGEVCAPCYDPTSQEPTAPTGACSIGCDAPVEPPLELTCPWEGPPVVDPARFPACAPACGGAHCVPSSLVPSNLQDLLATCEGGFCAPDPFISTAGNFVPRSCTSVAGAEGRCLSTCLPDVADKAGLLPRDVCGAEERCVPCFDPTSSDPTAATGACSTGCDMPTRPPVILKCPWTGPNVVDPSTFPACSPACGGSHCVPADLIPDDQRGLLATCPGGFCAPDPIIATNNNWVPLTCTSVAGAEGRCLSTCLPPIAAKANLLPQANCPSGMKCAPCFDPTAPGDDWKDATGACSIGCDAPTKPPVQLTCPWTGPPVLDPATLPECSPACAGSHCLPAALVPADQRDLLAPCPGGFCTPDPIIRSGDNWVPPTCASIAGAEGRCLSTCLPSVSGEPLLQQGTCSPGNKCVPCFNPIASDPRAPTGACGLGCDAPTDPPVILMCPWEGPAVIDPELLPACGTCGDAHCLPAKYVPDDQEALLAACSGGFCTPDPIIVTAGNFKAPSCIAFAGTPAEGRCLSTCLPIVAAQPSLERSSCPASERCAPCTDPFSGTATGACEVACDAPADPPYTFPGCCFDDFDNNRGTCVPRSQVPDGDEGRLEQNECPSNDYACIPNEMLPGGPGPSSCTFGFPPLGYNGTCYSRCLDLGIGEPLIPRGSCPPDYACVP